MSGFMICTASHQVFVWTNQREWDGWVMRHVGGEKRNFIVFICKTWWKGNSWNTKG